MKNQKKLWTTKKMLMLKLALLSYEILKMPICLKFFLLTSLNQIV